MFIVERNVFLDFHIDTNRINAKSCLKYMNILERWYENDVIYIEMAEVAQNEAANRGSSLRSEKAYSYIATETLARTPDEFRMLRQIIEVLFPNGIKSTNEKNDVEIVFNAWKYGRILVTDDGGSKKQPGGILGSRGKLSTLGIKVLRDYEAVELVKEKIIQRDQSALKVASCKKDPIPQWVGKDLDVIKTFLKNEKES